MAEFRMPALGADMEFGALLEWRVKPGDAVKRGDIVAVVDTSKAEIEVEVFEDGVIDELLVAEGTKRVPVGTVLATLRAGAGEESSAVAEGASAVAYRPRVSPLARRAAQELGVELRDVHGSGVEGAITRADVERAARPEPSHASEGLTPGSQAPAIVEASAPASQLGERQAAMREAIGSLMARSKREVPHYYLQREIDLSAALGWLEQENSTRTPAERVLPAAVLLAAVARACAETPAMNGFWVEGSFRPAAAVHLGVAISLRGGGLVAPALRDAADKSVPELMSGLLDLVRRARGGRLRASEMSDPTITVTNLGEQGADLVYGVIYPPQVALVGFGAIAERPRAIGGMLAARPVVQATLAADHRASDGHAGSRFLALVDQRLQKPHDL